MTGSLRRRMLVWTVGAMLLLLTAFAAVLYGAIHYVLMKQFDESLLTTALVFCASVEIDAGEETVEVEAGGIAAFEAPGASDCYGLYHDDGKLISRSTNAGPMDQLAQMVQAPAFGKWTGADGCPMRTVVLTFSPRIEAGDSGQEHSIAVDKLILVMARDATGLHRQLGLLGILLWGLSAATAVAAVGVGMIVVRRGLAPLETVAEQIAGIDPDDLGVRVRSAGMPTELRAVTEQLNGLLGRLEGAFERERRFTADAAHELRTPLAGLRSAIEVALTRPRDAGAYRAVLEDCLGMLRRVQSLVAGLLMLARLDAGQAGLDADDVRPGRMVEAWRDRMMDRLRGKAVAFECEAPPQIVCRANRQMLTMVLDNVLDNAAEYVNKGGSIHVAVRAAGRSVEIEVANTGSKLTDEQVAHVFERFWRADAARGDTENHAGLGLSLVSKAVEAMGGSVSACIRGADTFCLGLRLPAWSQGTGERP